MSSEFRKSGCYIADLDVVVVTHINSPSPTVLRDAQRMQEACRQSLQIVENGQAAVVRSKMILRQLRNYPQT